MVFSGDASDYVKRRKLAVIQKSNSTVDPSKFRALTSFSSYDPSVVKTTGIVCNDTCRTDNRTNNIFAAVQFRGTLYGR